MKEEWKEIDGYEGLYCVSNFGRIKSIPHLIREYRGRVMYINEGIVNKSQTRDGYFSVVLTKNGLREKKLVHILVAKAFINNPNGFPCVNHKDENKRNDIVSNLEWCTYSYNNTYGTVLERRQKKCNICSNKEKLNYVLTAIHNSKNNKSKKNYVGVAKIDINWNIIEIYSSNQEAAKKNNFDRHLLIKAKETNGVKHVKGMLFVAESKKRNYTYPKNMDVYKNKNKTYRTKRVSQYALDGTFLKEYSSIKDAGEYIGNPSFACDIASCCKGKLRTSHGFLWRYSNDDPPKPYKHPSERAICQFNFDGTLVNEYHSIASAARSNVNMSISAISNNLAIRGLNRRQ